MPSIQVLPEGAPVPLTKKTTRGGNVKKWFKGLFCGGLSFATCCCLCCGCCGHIKAPAVLYDEDEEYAAMTPEQKRMFHGVQWCGLAGLFSRCGPAMCCGCCCGACGRVTPLEAVACVGAMDAQKRRR
jgi:hypothetical protein